VTLPFRSEDEVAAAIPAVKAHLERDGLLAYPTETVYGLGSWPSVPALDALARLKGRAPDKPFLLLVSSRAMAEEWGLVLSPSARTLSAAFWPGPLTLVLPGGEGKLPDQLRGKEGGIAVRHTSHADRIRDMFAAEVERGELLVLDGGVLGNVPPSTLVDCTGAVPRLIREGAIPRGELRRAAGRLAP
jgi:L-threonylcarbamoyladenylate synthase